MTVNAITILSFFLFGLAAVLVVITLSLRRQTAPGTPQKPGPVSTFVRTMAAAVPQLQVELVGIERDLRRAGNYRPHAMTEYLAARNGLLLAIMCVALAAGVAAAKNPDALFIIAAVSLVALIICYGLPRMYLYKLASDRVQRIQQGLPDALDVAAMCLTGGVSLRDSLQRVGEELGLSHPDVAREFDIIRVQAEAGSMRQALRQFAQRIDVPDIKSLSAIVGHTERLGTNVALAVKDYADNVRRARRHRAEEHANKMTVKMLFPVVLCLAPPVFILLCGPPILELRDYLSTKGVLPSDIRATPATPAQTAQ